jgi:hypothetical protein
MTILRLISPSLRSGLLMAAGTVLIGLPFALGLSAAPIVTGTLVGIVMVALALAGTETSGRGTLPLAAQAAYDRGLGIGLLITGGLFGIADDPLAGLLFAAVGLTALAVSSVTRYSAHPA